MTFNFHILHHVAFFNHKYSYKYADGNEICESLKTVHVYVEKGRKRAFLCNHQNAMQNAKNICICLIALQHKIQLSHIQTDIAYSLWQMF